MATQAGVTTGMSSMAVARTNGSGATSGGPSITISGWLSRTSRAGPQDGASSWQSGSNASAGPQGRGEQLPEREHRLGRPDDRRALPPLPPRALGEHVDRLGGALHRDEVGPGPAHAAQRPALVPAPELPAGAAGPRGVQARRHEEVRDEVARAQLERLLEILPAQEADR